MQFLGLCAYFWEGTAYYRDFSSRSCGQPNRITIDLTFASEDVAARVTHCKIDRSLDCESDHLPIAIAIDWSWQPAQPKRERLWAKTNLPLPFDP